MKDHFCSIEKEWIGYEGQCNWCGEKELLPKRTWVGLTEPERQQIVRNFCLNVGDLTQNGKSVAIAIEAKLKAKNERLEKNT